MATLLDNRTQSNVYAPDVEAEKHNALIRERYERLRMTEETQLHESFTEAEREKAYAQYAAPRASVLAPERPVEVSAPVTETPSFAHTRVESPLFTTETLERTISEGRAEAAAPVLDTYATAHGEVYDVPAPVYHSEAYSLSRLAKGVLAAFGATVVVMLSIIGLNTRNIQKKNVKLRQLEDKRAELESRDVELENRIEEATSFERVSEWAAQNGYVFD